MSAELRDEIARALNRHSAENRSDTPDHLLADYLLDALAAFDRIVTMRENWYGRYLADKDTVAAAPERPKLAPVPAVRLLRAKAAEMELQAPFVDVAGHTGEIAYLAAQIGLVAELLADTIERAAT